MRLQGLLLLLEVEGNHPMLLLGDVQGYVISIAGEVWSDV